MIFVPNCYPFIGHGNILGKFGSIQCMLPKHSEKALFSKPKYSQGQRICCQWELPVDNLVMYKFGKVRQNKELKEFQNQDKWNRSFQGKFQENLEIAEFLKANHSIQNSGNSTRKVKWNGNFIFKNWCTYQGCPLFWKFKL